MTIKRKAQEPCPGPLVCASTGRLISTPHQTLPHSKLWRTPHQTLPHSKPLENSTPDPPADPAGPISGELERNKACFIPCLAARRWDSERQTLVHRDASLWNLQGKP